VSCPASGFSVAPNHRHPTDICTGSILDIVENLRNTERNEVPCVNLLIRLHALPIGRFGRTPLTATHSRTSSSGHGLDDTESQVASVK